MNIEQGMMHAEVVLGRTVFHSVAVFVWEEIFNTQYSMLNAQTSAMNVEVALDRAVFILDNRPIDYK